MAQTDRDDWRDYKSEPSTPPFPDADGRGTWVEVPVRCRIKGTGTVRVFHLEPSPAPERMFRIVASGEATVKAGSVAVIKIARLASGAFARLRRGGRA